MNDDCCIIATLHAHAAYRHSIWIGQYGKPDGKPLLFIHGGCGVQSRSEELGADVRCPADPAAEQTTRSMSQVWPICAGLMPFTHSTIFFDPEVYRIILFDQRGSGKSKPASELEDNTTWALVEDIEKVRLHPILPDLLANVMTTDPQTPTDPQMACLWRVVGINAVFGIRAGSPRTCCINDASWHFHAEVSSLRLA